MSLWSHWLQTPVAETLVSTLLHTFWQATLAALLLAVVLRVLPGSSTRARYCLAVACLLGVLVSALLTWSMLRYEGDMPSVPSERTLRSDINTSPLSTPEKTPAIFVTDSGFSANAIPTGETRLRPTAVLLLAWMVGAALFLLRAGRSIADAQRLVQGPLCDDPQLLAVLEEVRRLFGMTRRVRTVLNDCLQSPVVVGVLQPTLVLPASLMTGLTPDDLRALFAHELAHIRRHDYLINLMQLVVESLLFFNPAVWWISHQIRVEREACCDQLVVGLTDQPLRYAQLLANWATQMREAPSEKRSPAAIALANGNRYSLLDRIRRILSPGERPLVRLSWVTCVGFLTFSLTGLFLLQRGADMTVSLAAQLLSDEERIAIVTEAADQYDGGNVPKENYAKLTISGRIVTADGQPYVGKIRGDLSTRLENSSSSSTVGMTAPEFRVTAKPGVSWLQVDAPGYASTYVGPFNSSQADYFEQVEVVLRAGVLATVRVVDEKGQGVPDANVTIIPIFDDRGSSGSGNSTKTKEEGYSKLEHLNPDFPYRIYVTAAGFQRLGRKVAFEEIDGLELAMTAAQAVTGRIVDAQGEPVTGATLKIYRSWRDRHMNNRGRQASVLATTDADGQFTLDQLADGWVYHLLIEADGYGTTILADVKPGSSGWRVPMSPALTIRGRVEGTAEQLAKLSKQRLLCEQQFPSGHSPGAMIRLQEFLEIEDVEGVLRFEVDGLAPVKTLFKKGRSRITLLKLSLTESLDDVAISLQDETPFELRKVVVRFTKNGQPVQPTGQLKANIYRVGAATSTNETLPLVDGELHLKAPVPGTLSVDSEGMLGYWIPRFFEWPKVPAGNQPLVIEVPVYAAGAVQGKVLQRDGQPAIHCGVSVSCLWEMPAGKSVSTSFGYHTKTADDGQFFVTPVPIGAKCIVSFGSTNYRQVLPAFTLQGSQPTQTLAMQLGEVVTASGVALLPGGKPAVGLAVGLAYRHLGAESSWSPPEVTDGQGRFLFEGLRSGATEYVVEYKSSRDYLPTSVPLSAEGKPVVLQLTTGKILEGVAIDQATDRPVAGVRVYAHPVDWNAKSGEPYAYEAEARADVEGRFRFSNLPNRTMVLNASELRLKQSIEVEPGGEPVTLRGEVAVWYREKL